MVRILHHVAQTEKHCRDYLRRPFKSLSQTVVEQLDAAGAEEHKQLKKRGHHQRKASFAVHGLLKAA